MAMAAAAPHLRGRVSSVPSITMSFKEHLWDGFDAVTKHTEEGVAALKEVSSFLKKFAKLNEDFAEQMRNLVSTTGQASHFKKLMGKATISARAAFGTLGDSWTRILDDVIALADCYSGVASDVMSCHQELQKGYLKEKEPLRKQAVEEGTKSSKELQAATQRANKVKDALDRLKQSNAGLASQYESSTTGFKTMLRISQKKQNLDSKIDDTTKELHEATDALKANQRVYYLDVMPRVLRGMQSIEEDRIDSIRVALSGFVSTLERLPEVVTDITGRMFEAAESVQKDKDIQTFIRAHATGRQPPEGLTAQKEEPNPNAVFERTLDEIMENPEEKGDVPRILSVLINTIMDMDGTYLTGPETEGIFRVPGDHGEVKALRAQFNKGIYEIHADDVHVPGSLLKLWLRELKDPLIPPDFYDESVGTKDGATACALITRIPSLNQAVVRTLIGFLQVIALPKNVAMNRMNEHNLALVFAPAFLRNPAAEDGALLPSELSAEMNLQFQFVENLIKHLTGCPSPLTGAPVYGRQTTPERPPVPRKPPDISSPGAFHRLLGDSVEKVHVSPTLPAPPKPAIEPQIDDDSSPVPEVLDVLIPSTHNNEKEDQRTEDASHWNPFDDDSGGEQEDPIEKKRSKEGEGEGEDEGEEDQEKEKEKEEEEEEEEEKKEEEEEEEEEEEVVEEELEEEDVEEDEMLLLG